MDLLDNVSNSEKVFTDDLPDGDFLMDGLDYDPDRFSDTDVAMLIKYNVPDDIANQYDKYFSAEDICKLWEGKTVYGNLQLGSLWYEHILPDIANQYLVDFNELGLVDGNIIDNIIVYANHKIGKNLIKKYNTVRFDANEVYYFIINEITGDESNSVSKRLDGEQIISLIKLIKNNPDASTTIDDFNSFAGRVSDRFDSYELYQLFYFYKDIAGIFKSITIDEINNLADSVVDRYSGFDVYALIYNNYYKVNELPNLYNYVDVSTLNYYADVCSSRYESYDVFRVVQKGIPYDDANIYANQISEFYQSYDLVSLIEENIGVDEANDAVGKYDKFYSSFNVVMLLENNIPYSKANDAASRYKSLYSDGDVLEILEDGIPLDVFDSYMEEFEIYERLSLFDNGIYPDSPIFDKLSVDQVKEIIKEWRLDAFKRLADLLNNTRNLNSFGQKTGYDLYKDKTSLGNYEGIDFSSFDGIESSLEGDFKFFYDIDPELNENFKLGVFDFNADNIMLLNKRQSYTYEQKNFAVHNDGEVIYKMNNLNPLIVGTPNPLLLPLGYEIVSVNLDGEPVVLGETEGFSLYKNVDGGTFFVLDKNVDSIEINISKTNVVLGDPINADLNSLFSLNYLPNDKITSDFKNMMLDGEANEKAFWVKEYINDIARYGKSKKAHEFYMKKMDDGEISSQQYIKNMFDYYKKYGEITMICNQSALLSVALLREYGVPARYVSGLQGGSELKGPGHAWVEYRDGEKWQSMDPTPGTLSDLNESEKIATDFYDRLQPKDLLKDKNLFDAVDNVVSQLDDMKQDVTKYQQRDINKDKYFSNVDVQKEYVLEDYISACDDAIFELDSMIGMGSSVYAVQTIENIFLGYTEELSSGDHLVGFKNNLMQIQSLVGDDPVYEIKLQEYLDFQNKVQSWIDQININSRYLLVMQDIFDEKLQEKFKQYQNMKNQKTANSFFEGVIPVISNQLDNSVYKKYGSYDNYKLNAGASGIFWSAPRERPDWDTWQALFFDGKPEERLIQLSKDIFVSHGLDYPGYDNIAQ